MAWVDLLRALKADPKQTSAIQQAISNSGNRLILQWPEKR